MDELRRISIIWGAILVIIFSVLTFFGIRWKNKTSPYFALEDKLVKETKSYFESKYNYPNSNETIKITLDELKENQIIDEFKVLDDECNGYVNVTYNKVIDFKGFIKCNEYTTKGYKD